MAKLYLLRHAKAGWALPGMRDFDRSLDKAGTEEATSTGAVMRDSGYDPDLTLCSNARRARETLAAIAGSMDTGRVTFLDKLYTEDASFYLDLVRQNGHLDSIMIIGHNPMMEDLAIALSGHGEAGARDMLNHGFPTSGLAVLRFEGSLSQTAPGKGYLEAFITPVTL